MQSNSFCLSSEEIHLDSNKCDAACAAFRLFSVVHIICNDWAFAALRRDGAAVTWGQDGSGGDSSAVSDQLKNVTLVSAAYGAFAAITGNASVVCWP